MIISHEPRLSQSIHDFSSDYKNNFLKNLKKGFQHRVCFIKFNTNNWNDISRFNSKIVTLLGQTI